MESAYQLIATVNSKHTYFEDTICKGLFIIPDKDTVSLFNQYGLVFKLLGSGFQIIANTSLKLPDETQVLYFRFEIKITDASFFNYTVLPENNLSGNLYSAANTNPLPDIIQLIPTSSTPSQTNVFGYIQIDSRQLLACYKKKVVANFEICFTAKQTQWNYIIIPNFLKTKFTLSIGNDTFRFLPPKDLVLPDGQKALLFSSGGHLIPYAEKSTTIFSLFEQNADGQKSKMLIKNLPVADARSSSTYITEQIAKDAAVIFLTL